MATPRPLCRRYPCPIADTPETQRTASSAGQWQATYAAALAGGDLRRSRELLREAAAAGHSPARLYIDVLRPTLAAIVGHADPSALDVAQRVALSSARATLTAIGALPVAGALMGGDGRRALVSVGSLVLDELDGQVIVDTLRADGWRVAEVAADAPANAVCEAVRAGGVELVVLPTSNPADLLLAARTYTQLRQLDPPPAIVACSFGEPDHERRGRAVGADAFVTDPDALVAALDG